LFFGRCRAVDHHFGAGERRSYSGDLVLAVAGYRAGAAGGRGGVRHGPSEPAGGCRRDRGPGRRHRRADHPHRAVLRPGAGGAGRGGRQAVARAGFSRGRRCPQMTRYLTRDRAAIAAALVAPLAAAAILLPFRSSWPNTNVALLLVVVVVAVAAIGNRAAGAMAAIGAAVWFDFFFTLPYERFTIRSSADVTTFVLLLVAGAVVSQLAAYARRLKVVAITDAGYLAQIHDTASLTQTAKSPDEVADRVREQLAGLLD